MKTPEKIKTTKELVEIVDRLKKKGKKIVTLNGSFDILHPGHIFMIEKAKAQGDILIVALNSDGSIRRNKGEKRPINNVTFRAEMMAALQDVDYVAVFDEDTPLEFLGHIKPDIHVNGSEYGKECIEKKIVEENGGKIYIVKLKPGYSTTDIIKKIKNS